MPCPFRKAKEDDDLPEPEDIKFLVPARRAEEEDRLRNITTLAVAPKELRTALERMAAFQREGGLQSIPRFPELRATPDFPFSGRGHPEIISVLAAIAVMQGLRLARSRSSRRKGGKVAASENRAARVLTRALSPQQGSNVARGSPGQGRPLGPGRGGFLFNAGAQLRADLGFGFRKRFGQLPFNPHGLGGFPQI